MNRNQLNFFQSIQIYDDIVFYGKLLNKNLADGAEFV